MFRKLKLFLRLLLKGTIQAPTKIVEEQTNTILPEVQQERQAEFRFNWNVDLVKEFPDEPQIIHGSDLSCKEPIGYLWSNGLITKIPYPYSKVLKTIEEDEWEKSREDSHFNNMIESGYTYDKNGKVIHSSNTYILKEKEDVSKD